MEFQKQSGMALSSELVVSGGFLFLSSVCSVLCVSNLRAVNIQGERRASDLGLT